MKIKRDAFLYLDPKGDKNEFAQCSTCAAWASKDQTCGILGKKVKVTGGMSCGFYTPGKPMVENPDAKATFTPEQVGLVDRSVRCENCRFFNAEKSGCKLFYKLTEDHPDMFDLDSKVDQKGCCNAQVPGKKITEWWNL